MKMVIVKSTQYENDKEYTSCGENVDVFHWQMMHEDGAWHDALWNSCHVNNSGQSLETAVALAVMLSSHSLCSGAKKCGVHIVHFNNSFSHWGQDSRQVQ